MVDLLHDPSGLVPHHLGEAVILVGSGDTEISWQLTRHSVNAFAGKRVALLNRRHIEYAVTKGAEYNRGVSDIGLVCEHDLENGDVFNDRR